MITKAIINAMMFHVEDMVLQMDALGAIKVLAPRPIYKQALMMTIGDDGRNGTDAVLCCMWIHFNTPDLLGRALVALNNIAVSTQYHIVGKMTHPLLQVVLSVMLGYPMYSQLQFHACVLLRSYSYDAASLYVMQQDTQILGLLVQHLTSTAELFPQCQRRARDVLDKLCNKVILVGGE